MAGRTPSVRTASFAAALDALEHWLQSAGARTEASRLDVREIARVVREAGKLPRARLVAHLREVVSNRRSLTDEATRVIVAKITVALLPDSAVIIRAVLQKSPTSWLGELQFSLFVFLSDAPELLNQDQMQSLRSLVEHYLLSVRSKAAQAAWMAGDMLGDHWPLAESLPILLRVVRSAKHVAGREGALHGLAHAIERASKREQWAIAEQLKAGCRYGPQPGGPALCRRCSRTPARYVRCVADSCGLFPGRSFHSLDAAAAIHRPLP
jgi:hypothetical protein